ESFALYHALASRHVPVRFIGIPGAHHMPQDPVHRELYYRAIEDWVVANMQPSNRAGLPAAAVARADTRRSAH
ncbi:hypothetical protein, partial [Metallibacterium sp.]|uniref:hypothetical protein n=1 Tax=Metallibacterium sp. TaxID=2940281 RepID=UPI002624F832